MSWEQQTYSFGNPNAQPPTPTQTPTSGQFPSPVFQTPRNNNSSFEARSGWSPAFAEEYSVFNSTPGRLINTQHSFAEEPTPRALTTSTQIRHLSAGSDIAAEIASHVHHFSPNPSLPLPPVDPSNLLPSSPGPYSTTHNRFDDSSKQKVTPRKPRKRLGEAFSGQTATPPATASKGSRKLAPKLSRDKMQNDSQDSQYGASQTPTQSAFMSFTEGSGDFFSFPMSAPATAPAFINGKPSWNPDASMSGMDMDFSIDSMFNTNTGSHKLSNSVDWGRSNQMFQETMNVPQQSQDPTGQSSVSKRQRPIAPKLSSAASSDIPTSIPPYSFHSMSVAEDPFGMTDTTGSVDPGLLFSRPSSQSTSSNFGDVQLPPPRPVTSQGELRPYQHQLRESRRDQEELRRSRSSRENSRSRRMDRATVSSPVRSSRPSIQRSVSERGRRTQDRAMLSRSGRISPVKQRPSILTSIPELLPPRTRTEVKFTIDANGRARTETVLVEEPRSRRGGSIRGEEFETSSYDSSSDDEPILIPSRNSSFNLPNAPKLSRFETSGRALDNRRQSSYSQSESSSQRSFRQQSVESEAETVMEEDDGSGDATRELRKVMENRKKIQMKPRDPYYNHQLSGLTPRGNDYTNYSSTNISPTTITDPGAPTPSASSSRSGTTRCVCNNPDSEGFMIQCESCDNWLHAECVNIDRRSLPPVYICAFCANTPNTRGGRTREPARKPLPVGSSPLARKSFRSFR